MPARPLKVSAAQTTAQWSCTTIRAIKYRGVALSARSATLRAPAEDYLIVSVVARPTVAIGDINVMENTARGDMFISRPIIIAK